MMDLMRRALARPRGDSKRRRGAAIVHETEPGNAASPSQTYLHPVRAKTAPTSHATPPAQPSPQPATLSAIGATHRGQHPLPEANGHDPTLVERGSVSDGETAGVVDDASALVSVASLTTSVSEQTPARSALLRSVAEADDDAEHFLDPAAKSAMYTAYTDALHKEARSSSGGLRRVVELLREHERNAVVVENAALTIGVLSKNDAATRNVFGQYGALEALLQTLTINERSAAVVERVAQAVCGLVRDSPRNVRLFEKFDGVMKLAKVASSKRFEDIPAIAVNALTAIAALKHRLDASEARIVHRGAPGAAKTISYVLRAMRVHEHRVDVQEPGLDAMRTLIVGAASAGLQPALLTKCVRVASSAYRMHGGSKDVQWQTLALQCDVDDIRDGHYLVELDVDAFFGALRAVVADGAAMRAEQNGGPHVLADAIAGLVSRALGTASRVGCRSLDRNDSAADAGAVDVCLETLAAFSDNREIVEKTCSVMRSLLDSLEGRLRLDCLPTACALLSAIETTSKAPSDAMPVWRDVPYK